MKLTITARSVYGNTLYYVTSSQAAAVATLTRKKTVDFNDIMALESLGFTCVMAGSEEVPAASVMNP